MYFHVALAHPILTHVMLQVMLDPTANECLNISVVDPKTKASAAASSSGKPKKAPKTKPSIVSDGLNTKFGKTVPGQNNIRKLKRKRMGSHLYKLFAHVQQ